MSRSIVCGVDDSLGAREAVRVAAWLADRLDRTGSSWPTSHRCQRRSATTV